jgi:predicted secreted protein
MAPLTITLEDDGTEVRVAVGDDIWIELAETPTTGYTWQPPRYSPDVVELVESLYMPTNQGAIGGAGSHVFKFDARGSGRSPVQLDLRRAWERDAEPSRSFLLTIVVE